MNIFKYIYDIGRGIAESSKLKQAFFVQIIILAFVLLFTGIFNIKPEGMTNKKNSAKKTSDRFRIRYFLYKLSCKVMVYFLRLYIEINDRKKKS